MPMIAEREPMAIAPEELTEVRALYEEGLCLRAYERARAFGPLQHWRGTAARILAGGLAANLGAPRLGTALHLRAWREDPSDPDACFYRAFALLTRRGPLRAWEFLGQVGLLADAPEPLRGYWLALSAIVLGQFRDFDAAESWLARAEDAAPARPWLLVQRSNLYEMEDRYDEALDSARAALARRPWYRPAVQQAAHLLQLLDRDAEAVALLAEAVERIEGSAVAAQLGGLQAELGRHAEAMATWDRFAAMSPMIDGPTRRWLAGRRSDAAYGCGDFAAAAVLARQCGDPFFHALAGRLEAAASTPTPAPTGAGRRVLLDVGFVRQHHQTCAPATLAAIAGFWGRPADHLEVAEEICYDGTPDHRQRSWAERNGWVTREFTATWDSALALLDRGVPFTLATVETQSAHLQAVIGYDARRGTLLIRDPSLPYAGEALAAPFLQRYRSVGPRGMAMVPREHAGRLEGLDLPEAPLYDDLQRMQAALHAHDRDGAATAYESLRDAAPGHRLALHARCLLAHYDADPAELLAGVEGLLQLFPDDVNLRLSQLGGLRVLGRRGERLALYRELCGRTGADPLLRRQYAQELLADARERPAAVRLVRRALRARPRDAPSLALLAAVARDQRRAAEAVALYRLAACCDDKDEGLARTYFHAARDLHREEDALRFLAGRFRRFAARSGWPARTLSWALAQLERMAEAFAVLDEAMRLRPGDGELHLFVAEAYGARGEFDRAAERLEAARGLCRHGNWLRAAARLASFRGDPAGALALWQQVLRAEPLALDANRSVAQHLAETEGRAAALDHLARACDRFPHNVALHQARIEWLRADGPAAVEPAVRRLLAIHPADAWAHRELALTLATSGRHEEAAAELRLATQLEPESTTEAAVRGQVLELAACQAEARAAYREAIRRSADNEFAMGRLLDACDSRAEELEALAFIEAELARQVTLGDGLLAFARRARRVLEPDVLLAALRRAREVRPDLWQAWSALVRELAGRGDAEEALELARRAAAQFPLLPGIWLDLAAACAARGDHPGELEALDRALRISPGWGMAARRRAAAYQKDGDHAAARSVLERAVAHDPLDAENHGDLAHVLRRLGQARPALDRLAHALRLDPGPDGAWTILGDWSRELGRPELPLELARELTAQRGGEARSWVVLARLLDGPDRLDERLAALERAVALNPRADAAYDLKAQLLAEAGRWDQAEAACRPSAWGDRPPVPLRGRAAWVLARRGDLTAAMARMRPVLAENPDYSWGWFNLAEWAAAAGTPAAYLEVAEALVRLVGDNAVAAGYRADARSRTGDRAGAKEDYRRAFELAPDRSVTAMRLFDLELEERDLDAAGRVLQALRAHDGGEFVLARAVQLARARGDGPAAAEALERLCACPPGASEWPLATADRSFKDAGWGRQAEAIYDTALSRPVVHPQIGSLWVQHCTARRHWRCTRRFDELLAHGEVGRRALAAYLSALGRARASWKIGAYLRRYRRVLREHTLCWGTAGFALTSVVRHRAAAELMSDWHDRDRAQPWMLINLALALRALRRVAEANRVGRHALTLRPDFTSPYHAIWLALDDLIDGDGRETRVRLEHLDPARFDETHRFLFRLAQLLLRRARAEPAQRDLVREDTSRVLASLTRSHRIPADNYGAVLQTYRRAVGRLARDYGPVRGLLWKLARWLRAPRKGR
jgi:tetratricopeptide (TPR) repeat protein